MKFTSIKKFEIINRKFTFNDKIYEKTALLTVLKDDKEEINIERGFIDTATILNQLLIDKKIDISHSFLLDFNISYFAETISAVKFDNIEQINAENAIFLSNEEISIDNLKGLNATFNFQNCFFQSPRVVLSNLEFETAQFNFHNAIIKTKDFEFVKSEIENGDIDFKNAHFSDGRKSFQYLKVKKGTMLFNNVEFNNGDLLFINSHFAEGTVSFKISSKGKGKSDFHYAKFLGGEVTFEKFNFGEGEVNFEAVEFHSTKVNFNKAQFNGNVSFDGVEMKEGKMFFKRSEFSNGKITFIQANMVNCQLYMDNSNFNIHSLSFKDAYIKHISLNECHLDHYVDLRVHKAESINLSDTIIRDIVDITPIERSIDIKIINFTGVRVLGNIYIDWKRNNVKDLIYKQDTTWRNYREQFRILKQNFNTTGQYADEDAAYIEYRRSEEKYHLYRSIRENGWSRIWAYPIFYFKRILFDRMGLYATSPFRVLLSMLTVMFIFSFIYSFLPSIANTKIITANTGIDVMNQFQIGLYHSMITFFTIGYGDYFPIGMIRWISGFEGFCGVFFMSYFIVAYVRYILR